MMKSWKECRDEVMAELGLSSDYNFYPKQVFDVYIYKGGKVVEILKGVAADGAFTGKDAKIKEALKRHDTKIYEAWGICSNELEMERAKYLREAIKRRAFDVWHTALREEFSEVNEAVFDICYDQAYDRYGSKNYDDLAGGVCDMIYFAKKIIEANCRGFNND